MNYQEFEESAGFNETFSKDMQYMFDYMNLRDEFEIDGEFDPNIADFAKEYGYYLDENYDIVTGQKVMTQIPNSPGAMTEVDGSNTADPNAETIILEEDVVEYLTRLGRYYKAYHRLFVEPSNFAFYADYEGQVITNDIELNENTAQLRGKYAIVSSGKLEVDNNLSEIPNTFAYQAQTCVLNEGLTYKVILSVNTEYPCEDIYSELHAAYQKEREQYFEELSLAIAGLAGMLITFIIMLIMLLKSDLKDTEAKGMDRLAVELRIILCLALIVALLILNEYVLKRLYHMVLPVELWSFVEKGVNYIFIYACLVSLFFSIIRSWKRGDLAKNSYIKKWSDDIQENINSRVSSQRLIIEFVAYLVIGNALLFGSALLVNKGTMLMHRFMAAGLALMYILLNIFVFYRLYKAAQASDRDEARSERLKADLITNVSHDIKTPLTSIINYIDLIKREQPTDPKIVEYLKILEQKSQHLKTLTDDLVEASKASSGNVNLDLQDINFAELAEQACGEFEEKFAERQLTIVSNIPIEPMIINADGNSLWRVLENLYINAFKYASEGSRVYVDMTRHSGNAVFTIKNVSANQLNINADELTERFVRGDVSRNTEGSGLGLSIARSLTEIQGGKFSLSIDGDLFKAIVSFPLVKGKN